MDRVTVRFPEGQIEELERLVEAGVFPSRSEAIRWAVRQQLVARSDGKKRSRDPNAATL